MATTDRTRRALTIIERFGGFDGAHHNAQGDTWEEVFAALQKQPAVDR